MKNILENFQLNLHNLMNHISIKQKTYIKAIFTNELDQQ
ncbi:unnamed protein product [Paramecium sonneborni]|uniref:Uncharacterized protein n=1 Tax=Paramecium sonneborni TaxID=65129 RepID=A0A8S1R042_9CILI|nr:unnamed protein product [Paramecium sonneborni]